MDGSRRIVFATGCLAALLAFALPAPVAAGNLLVADFLDGRVQRYDATTGSHVNLYVPSAPAPHGITLGPDCNLYVTSASLNAVLRFSTTTEPTGAPLPSSTGSAGTAEFVAPGAGGLNAVGGPAFGPDGHLYVASANGVLRFDGTTGAYIDTFVADGSGGLAGAALLGFGADGDLYVPGTANGGVLRFDGTTGAPKPGPFGTPGTAEFAVDASLVQVHNFTVAPNGNLYVPDYAGDQILEFDGATGALLGTLLAAGSGIFPHGIRFGPGGDFYTTSLGESEVHRFQADGTYVGVFIAGTGEISGASDLVFPSPTCGVPVTVPDGTDGTQPLTVDKLVPSGATLRLTWDSASCQGAAYHLLHGSLSSVASYSLDGASCDLGTSGSFDWSSPPGSSSWFLVVADDGTGTEGGWGDAASGGVRNGGLSSGLCGNTQRDDTGGCSTP